MKGKAKQYVLLGLVVLIWGVIIFRFLSYKDTEGASVTPIKVNRSEMIPRASAVYRYHLNYADPFLKNFAPEPSPSEPVQPQKKISDPPRELPDVSFVGVVSSGDRMTGIVRINSRSLMVSSGETVMDFQVKEVQERLVRLVHVPTDSIIVVKPLENSIEGNLSRLN